jgi:hypothetical protein
LALLDDALLAQLRLLALFPLGIVELVEAERRDMRERLGEFDLDFDFGQSDFLLHRSDEFLAVHHEEICTKRSIREVDTRWLQIWLTVEPDELILLKARKSYRAVGGSGPEGA